jgi:hypothetical protein
MLRGVHTGRAARIVCTVAAAVCCGAAASVGVYASLRTGQVDASQVSATVVEPAVPSRSQPAIGQWTTPAGTQRFGVIPAPPERPAGSGHQVWIDKDGYVTGAPTGTAGLATQASIAGASVAAAIVVIACRPRDRCDDAIDSEWSEVVNGIRKLIHFRHGGF